MRLVSALAVVAFSSPAFAAGLTGEQFSTSWIPLPSLHFSAWARAPAKRVALTHLEKISTDVLGDAFASALDIVEHHDLAIDEIAAGWEPGRLAALEDLREAQRTYAVAAGGDRSVRALRFLALLRQVVDNSGRSVAEAPSTAGAGLLSQIYDRVLRDASDSKLASIEASETAWVAYRDAFDRFAQAMDRPDAAKMVRDDLARRRAEELQVEMTR